MNKVNAEMQEHGDMVMLPVSHLGSGLTQRVSSNVESSHQECLYSSEDELPRFRSEIGLG
jgi:hypothetical protein